MFSLVKLSMLAKTSCTNTSNAAWCGALKYMMKGLYFQQNGLTFVGCFYKPCRTLTGPNDSYEMAAHTMTDPPPCLTPGKRHCGLNAFFHFLQTETGSHRKQRQFINRYYFYLGFVSSHNTVSWY